MKRLPVAVICLFLGLTLGFYLAGAGLHGQVPVVPPMRSTLIVPLASGNR